MNLSDLLPDIVEFKSPILPGDAIASERLSVVEVRRLLSTLTLAGKPRCIYVAVHEKKRNGSMLTMFVVLDGCQPEWAKDADE